MKLCFFVGFFILVDDLFVKVLFVLIGFWIVFFNVFLRMCVFGIFCVKGFWWMLLLFCGFWGGDYYGLFIKLEVCCNNCNFCCFFNLIFLCIFVICWSCCWIYICWSFVWESLIFCLLFDVVLFDFCLVFKWLYFYGLKVWSFLSGVGFWSYLIVLFIDIIYILFILSKVLMNWFMVFSLFVM